MKKIKILLLIVCAYIASSAEAATWRFDPRFIVKETYTDNLFLDANNERSDYITEVTPGINIRGDGRNLKLRFDYQYQNLFYADNGSMNDGFNQLRSSLNSELIDDHFFVEANADIGQTNISNQNRVTNNNINITGNRTNTAIFSISPIYKQSFAGLVDAEIKYTYSYVKIDTGAGDSNINQYNFRLNDGRRFNRFKWYIRYSKRDGNRNNNITSSTNPNTSFETTEANATFPVSRNWTVITEAGAENSEFTTTRNRRNGKYAAIGFGYQPNRRFLVEVVGGGRDRITLNWKPSTRSAFNLTFRRQDFGANPGDAFNAFFMHRTRRSNWELTYVDETTTAQDVLLNDRTVQLLDNNGNPVFDPLTNQPILITPAALNLRNDVFNRKRLNLAVSYRTGKSTIRFSIFDEVRDSEVNTGTEKGRGTTISWRWRLSHRTESVMSANWRHDETNSTSSKSNLYDVNLNLIRRVSRRTSANLLLRHVDRNADASVNTYTENSLSAGVRSTF